MGRRRRREDTSGTKTIESYPYCERYRYWPGPNSNTFVAWVLREAGIDYKLSRKGLGQSYLTAKQ